MLWLGLYIAMVLGPIALVFIPPLPPARTFWVEFGVGLGFVGLSMMGVQFALTARFRWIAGKIGMDSMLHFHRQAGIVGFFFVLAHPIVLILANRDYLDFFDPRVNFMRTAALVFALVALLAIVGLSIWRKTLRFPYQWWRLSHGVLSASVILIGLGHTLMVGHYVSIWWKQAMWIALVAASILLLIQMRLLRPWGTSRRPWRVEGLIQETERVWTLQLVPLKHDGLQFRAGQCVWLSVGSTPFTLESHPFTISSSAEVPEQIRITIKELGDWTSNIGKTKPGTPAFLEGPYGAFILPEDDSVTMVMIAGGIGVTPFLSMLRTMRDRGDTRRVLLIFGGATLDRLPLQNDLDDLSSVLDLKIVKVLEDPPDDWNGERGFITSEILQRQKADYESSKTFYFVCGPEPMMDVVEKALLKHDVPMHRILSERFEIA